MMRALAVERLAEAADAAAWTTDEERAAAAAFGSEQRRSEYLGWRAVVRRRLGRATAIGYDAAGAPVAENAEGLRIAVSHCRGYVAVGFADGRCGVDIERRDRNFGRIVRRYLTPDEQALSADTVWPGVAWCAKEALYKAAGRRGLDLRGDIALLRAELRATAADVPSGADVSDASLVRGTSETGIAGAAVPGTAGLEAPACLLPLAGCGEIMGRIGDGEPVRLAAWWNGEVILVCTV